MPCNKDDLSHCCGQLAYDAKCAKCRALAGIARFLVRVLGKESQVRFRAITAKERAQYRAPIFEGDDGDVVVGVWPCALRLLLELTHTRSKAKKGLVIHGTRRLRNYNLTPYHSYGLPYGEAQEILVSSEGRTYSGSERVMSTVLVHGGRGIVNGACCYICECKFNRHCVYCRAECKCQRINCVGCAACEKCHPEYVGSEFVGAPVDVEAGAR